MDGDHRELDYPVIDGARDISMDKLVQSDIHNATQRGFVKCVAINWGLGLSLWQKEENEEGKRRKTEGVSVRHNDQTTTKPPKIESIKNPLLLVSQGIADFI